MSDFVELRQKFIEEKLAEPDEYRIRYVAFLDLLGFKNITNEQNCAFIKAFFNDIELIKFSFDSPMGTTVFGRNLVEDADFTIMSDSIVIATENSYAGLAYLLFLCSTIQSRLLTSPAHPLLLRGGISCGNYYKLNNLSFGPAMTEAYLLENQANSPRVIIDPKIIEKMMTDGVLGQKGIDRYLSDSDQFTTMIEVFLTTFGDDFYFVDYFNTMELLRLSNSKNLGNNLIEIIQQTIRNGVNIENERVRQKYTWLRSFYNEKMCNSFFSNMTEFIINSEEEANNA